MLNQKKNPESRYRQDREDYEVQLRTYVELQSISEHLRDLKLIGVLLIATVAFQPIAWLLLIVAAIVYIASFLGKPLTVIVKRKKDAE